MAEELQDQMVRLVLPRVQTPGQYVGGELGSVRKDRRQVRGTICLSFPDLYSIGMSNHGLQVLYAVMNRRADWACERVFAPDLDVERLMRQHRLPWYSLESFTPLAQFDVLGFTLQYDLCSTNVLTILDLSGIPLVAAERTAEHPLVIAGGPCAMNPEPMARFIDLFVIGDGEEILPRVCDRWVDLRAAGADRRTALMRMAAELPHVYVPQLYRVQSDAAGRQVSLQPLAEGLPLRIEPAVVADLDAVPLPTAPVVPYIECVHDRISIEIMRGCPGRCRFCQSTTTKRPLRIRSVETIVAAAWESYRNTGLNEISLLSLSTSDYPHLDELVTRLQETFRPLGVSIGVPSLRVTEQLRTMSLLLNTDRTSGLTLAPEAARDAMRQRIGKPIANDDLYAGCRIAMERGFQRVKLYFMCGLPGEQEADLDGMLEMATQVSRLGKEVQGRYATVVVNVSNFIPKPQTPFQWNAMATREYFRQAHAYLRQNLRYRSIQLKYHDVETSMLEGVLARGDRRLGPVIEAAWRRGARFDAWSERFQPALWWQAIVESGIDVDALLHRPYPIDEKLPWDHIGIRQGREYLEREQGAYVAQTCALDCPQSPTPNP